MSAEAGSLIGVEVARVELAVYDGMKGSASLLFAAKSTNRILIHGNGILPGTVTGYDKKKRHRQKEHTIGNILVAIESLFQDRKERQTALRALASYLLLDGLIGNTDRRHETGP